jgi:hypothetical protein
MTIMDKKPSANADELGRKLQEKLRHERPRWIRWVPLLAIVLFATLLLLAWILYPAPDPPRVTATALDALVAANEPADVRAYLDPVDADAKPVSLAGLEAIFSIDKGAGAADDGARVKAVTDAHGQATATLDPGGAAKSIIQVRQTAPSKKQDSPTSRAALHVLPKDTPLLVVDVEETLADLDPNLWTKTNPLNIAPRPGAIAALREAQLRHKLTIVYLAVGNVPAKEYRRVQGWIRLKAAEPKGLPDGPVLGRLQYHTGDVAEARQALLADVRERFTGPMTAVVRTAESAEQCLALKIRPIAMGGGDFPGNVMRIKGWDELPAALGK